MYICIIKAGSSASVMPPAHATLRTSAGDHWRHNKRTIMDNLKEKTAKGLFWGTLNSGTTQVLNLVIGIFLARLLSPGEYGIVGMLTIFTAIAGNLQSSGFSTALINMKEPQHKDYNSVFWFNILTSITLYVILFFCAPLIASYFRQPCLVELSRFLFLAFVIGSFGIVPNAYMTKHLMVREITIVSTIALLSSGIAGIGLAIGGYSYWSLAWQQVIYISIMNIGRFYFTAWRPSLSIDFSPIRRMFPFSVKILITMIINTVNANILTVIFGRLFSARAVGNFTQAYKWDAMAYSLIANAVAQVAQPVFATISDEQERERRVFRKMMRFAAFLSFPVMFGLTLTANEFVLITITEEWAGSVILLQILSISGAFFPIYLIYRDLMIAKGRSDVYMWCNLAQIIIQIILILLVHSYGMTAMVTVYTIFNILWMLVWQHMAQRLIGVTLAQVLADIVPFALTAAAVMAVTAVATAWIDNIIVLFIARVVMAAALYFAVMKVAKVKILDECMAFIARKKRKEQ